MDGDIITEDAVIGGYISGTIVANNRLELQNTCMVEGEIQARPQHLKLDEGARFRGEVRMIEEGASEPVVTSVSTSAVTSSSSDLEATRSANLGGSCYPAVSQPYSDPRLAAQGDEEEEARVVA